MKEVGPVENMQRAVGEPRQRHSREERLLIVRPQDEADREAAVAELQDLPGVVGVTVNTLTRSFDIVFDSEVVSDDELAAALHHQGYDLVSWQEARQKHADRQRPGCSNRLGRSLDAPSSN
jgi:copper chaperone CopZ